MHSLLSGMTGHARHVGKGSRVAPFAIFPLESLVRPPDEKGNRDR
jgi:hypothetical protein